MCRAEAEERDKAERDEFAARLRARDQQEREQRHGGKAVAEDHQSLALDAGMDEKGKKDLVATLRLISEQAYLEKRQEKKLQVCAVATAAVGIAFQGEELACGCRGALRFAAVPCLW